MVPVRQHLTPARTLDAVVWNAGWVTEVDKALSPGSRGVDAVLNAIQQLIETTSSRNRPWQIALAVMLGLIVGLLPKVGLLPCLVALLAFVAPCHLPIAILVGSLMSFASLALSDQFYEVGIFALEHPAIRDGWLQLDRYPLVPWLGLHQPHINGAAIFCIALASPTFLLSYIPFKLLLVVVANSRARLEIQRDAEEIVERRAAENAIMRIDPKSSPIAPPKFLTIKAPATSTDHVEEETQEQVTEEQISKEAVVEEPVKDEFSPAMAHQALPVSTDDVLADLESILEECKQDQDANAALKTEDVLARANQLTELVDQILNDYDESTENSQPRRHQDSSATCVDEFYAGSDEALSLVDITTQENTPDSDEKNAARYRVDRAQINKPASSELTHESQQTPQAGALPNAGQKTSSDDGEGQSNINQLKLRVDLPEEDVIARQEESLRYLLNHLRGLHTEKPKKSADSE